MNIAKWSLCALTIAAACTPSAAHDHATGIVKERMEAMTSMAKRQKAISQRLKDKRELATIKADAEAIASLASHIPHMFPAGGTQPPTQARARFGRTCPTSRARHARLKPRAGRSPQRTPAIRRAWPCCRRGHAGMQRVSREISGQK
jgi:cytochrome c556